MIRPAFAVCLAFASIEAFVPTRPAVWSARSSRRRCTPLYSSPDDSLEEMRRLLEASWNTDTMGKVPSSPEAAAESAAASLQSAVDNGQSLFFVDLLLPSYDITQGENMYDEVLAIEFCIALAARLEDRTAILVRDDKRLSTVNRVLEARERNREEESIVEEDEEEDDDEEDDEEEDDDDDDDDSTETVVEFYDDFGDFGDLGGSTFENDPISEQETPPSKDSDDVDSFREQLLASWDRPPAEKPSAVSAESSSAEPIPKPKKDNKPRSKSKPKQSNRLYRLASMLGSDTISGGSDMVDSVVKALKANAMPKDSEGTIIILSAVSKEELVAVRSLVGTFKSNKRIVLVNCKLEPSPRELMGAETVYSILPLIARPTTTERNIFTSAQPLKEEAPQPKVVVMRRYPNDWEVYVDASGSGFELAESVPASQVGKKGPPMEWVAGCVKRHLQSKLG